SASAGSTVPSSLSEPAGYVSTGGRASVAGVALLATAVDDTSAVEGGVPGSVCAAVVAAVLGADVAVVGSAEVATAAVGVVAALCRRLRRRARPPRGVAK